MVLVLSFDVISKFTSVSLVEDGKIIDYLTENRDAAHCESLVLLIEMLMAKNNLKYEDFDLFSTSVGPGSFTGIKIAISAIKSIEIFSNSCVSGIDRFDIFSFAMQGMLNKIVKNMYVVLKSSEYFLLIAKFDCKFLKKFEKVIKTEDLDSYLDDDHIIVTDCEDFLRERFCHKNIKIQTLDHSESCYCALLSCKDFTLGKIIEPKEKYMVPLKIYSKH